MSSKIKNIYLFVILSSVALLSSCGSSRQWTHTVDNTPKREFRGAWIQTVGQSRYQQMNSAAMRYYLSEMVRKLDEAGINALIFQIRPEADAFYKSDIEPWSRFLTGVQGKAPDDDTFDPLQFIIQACHQRGMEFHAWLNPYRVKTSMSTQLAPNHVYWKYPERFIQYGNQLFFNPALPENRTFICDVVKDIVSRYDVDAIHMDDYFYPYPISGQEFPDEADFQKYAPSQGFAANQKADWRRNNVNLLIQELKYTIAGVKPWVRFGISPFGIYRNKKNTPDGSGSDTNGLENYSGLYADVKLWVEKGWIDYNVPQLYWERGHKAADYTTLLNWWNQNNYKKQLYIGQDVERSINKNEFPEKIRMAREMKYVHGNVFWYGYLITENKDGAADQLQQNIHRAKSLIPAYTHMHKGKPRKVYNLKEGYTNDTHFLSWTSDKNPQNPETAQYYVIYRFRKGEKVHLERAENIVAVTPDNFYSLPYEGGKNRYTYLVTALDGFKNESKGTKIKVIL